MRLACFVFSYLLSSGLLAQTFTTIQAGNLNAASIWLGGVSPGNTISASETVNILHAVTYPNDLTVNGGLINISSSGSLTNTNRNITVENGGRINANGLITTQNLEIEDNNSRVVITDSIYVDEDAEVNNNAKLIVTGNAFFNQAFEANNADSILFGGLAYVEDEFELGGNSLLYTTSTAALTVDNDLILENSASFIADGTTEVANDLIAENSATLTFNNLVKVLDDVILENNPTITFNANVYIDDDLRSDNGADIIIGPDAIVQVVDALVHDGGFLTINGALVVQNDGNTGESVNEAIINGNGLFQIDGDGLENDGTITGSLDVCSGNGNNPISGDAVSGSATICSNSGANFPIIPGAPLPVVLSYFDVSKAEQQTAKILWSTASELNAFEFVVYKSLDGVYFEPLAIVPAMGTTTNEQHYQVFDERPSAINYYQLVQFDFDGTANHLGTRVFRNDAFNAITQESILKLWPNPLSAQTLFVENDFIDAPNHVTFQMLNAQGRVVFSDQYSADISYQQVLQFEIPQLPSGFYWIQIFNENQLLKGGKVLVP